LTDGDTVPVVSCTAARNARRAAHLHWLKVAWHGAVDNLRPNLLCNRDVVATDYTREEIYGLMNCAIADDLQDHIEINTLPKGR